MPDKKAQHHSKVDEALHLTEGKGFEEDLQDLLTAENAEAGDNIIIVLVDLDHFMRVNTDFGFDEGDRVLIETGKHLQNYLGEQGTLYRVAGDEFGLIFKGDMEKEDIFLQMEDMRKNYNVKLPNGDAMTISIGIATAFENATRYQELFRMAESAMFRAKFSGRNKVALAKEEKMVPKTSHYTQDQLKRLNTLSKREGVGEAILLREAMDMLLKKYDV
ncbi:MAG: diguanylate cyclase domain-containing protein [Acetatifactor sp.]